jgi:hypothetical protein
VRIRTADARLLSRCARVLCHRGRASPREAELGCAPEPAAATGGTAPGGTSAALAGGPAPTPGTAATIGGTAAAVEGSAAAVGGTAAGVLPTMMDSRGA